MPGEKWKRSLQSPKQYEAVKKQLMADGMSEAEAKTRAAKISNAKTAGHTVKKKG